MKLHTLISQTLRTFIRSHLNIKNKEERITNERAVRIVAKLFYGDTPNEFRNWVDFMNEFNLPSWFEPLVKDAIYD